jgi:alpha-methylacyl-CoA racemase
MVDGSASLQAALYEHLAKGIMTDEAGSNPMAGEAPFYGVYETSDGRYVSVASAEPQFYRVFLDSLGIDPDAIVATQMDASTWPTVRARIAGIIVTRTQAEWCTRFEGTDCCFAPVLSMADAAAHPHNRERGTFLEIDGHVQAAPVPRFDRTPSTQPVSFATAQSDLGSSLDRWGIVYDDCRPIE